MPKVWTWITNAVLPVVGWVLTAASELRCRCGHDWKVDANGVRCRRCGVEGPF